MLAPKVVTVGVLATKVAPVIAPVVVTAGVVASEFGPVKVLAPVVGAV